MRALALVVSMAVMSGGCATTTTIRSEPAHATVIEKGRKLGKTPYAYTSEQWVWETRTVELEAPGYERAQVRLRRSELNTNQAIVSALVFWFLCLPAGVVMFGAGGMDFPDETFVRLDPATSSSSTSPLSPEFRTVAMRY